jgi:hypothetical protein
MAFNPNMVGNGNNDRPVNSRGIDLYGPESMAQIGYFNTFVSIALYPIKPPDQRGPKSMYDYNNRVSCVISKEDCLYLAWVLRNKFVPKTEAAEASFTGIQTGQNTMFCISNGVLESGKVEPYIAIFKGFDEKKRAMERRVFKFRPKITITKYDPETGESDALEDYRYGAYVLAEFFEYAAAALIGANANFERYFERFRQNDNFHIIRSIAGKLGVPVNNNQQGGNTYNGGSNFSADAWKSSTPSQPDLANNTISSSPSSMQDLAALMTSDSIDAIPGIN